MRAARRRSRGARAARQGSPGGCCGGCAILRKSPGRPTITRALADASLTRLEVDRLGLDAMDRRYLAMIADIYKGGPVGVETLAAGLAEPRDTIEDVVEPYLIQLGLVARTARGRCLNDAGWQHLDRTPPAGGQTGLFDSPGNDGK